MRIAHGETKVSHILGDWGDTGDMEGYPIGYMGARADRAKSFEKKNY